ncbi:MAG: P63C domain-containing protein [Candidatus Dormibacteria bacterium]
MKTTPTDIDRGAEASGPARGGLRRASALSPDERQTIAREAALLRWGDTLPRATHTGLLQIAGLTIACAVLQDGTRLLTQQTFLTALGRSRTAKGGTGGASEPELPAFLAAENLRPFISDELQSKVNPIAFRSAKGVRGYGYDALLLPMVCDVYLRANDEHVLLQSQMHIVGRCYMLMRGFAMVGIVALVDEATGYQEQRARDELTRILEHYISPQLLPWTKTFPDEFFRQLYRLQGWEYRPGSAKRTPFVGHLINKYIYEELPPGVLPELRRLNPVVDHGRRRHKHFQYLTVDTGNPHLDRQITAVTTLMRSARDKDDFIQHFERAFLHNVQERLPLIIEVPETSITIDGSAEHL